MIPKFRGKMVRWQIGTRLASRKRPARATKSAGAAEKDDRNERLRPVPRTIRLAVLRDARRRRGQYRDAVAAAGDRPRPPRRRHLGGGRVQPVGPALGGDGAGLGA